MRETLLVLHILVLAVSVGAAAGLGLLGTQTIKSGDARLIHKVFSTARPLQRLAAAGWGLGALLGVALVIEDGTPLDTPWLIWSYGTFAVMAAAGVGLHAPWEEKVIAASAASPDGAITPELDRLLRLRTTLVAIVICGLAFVALIYLMTARPV
jgi:uncharacterized membrane protein